MKLRILDNFLRLRLSQTEVGTLEAVGEVFGQTNFGQITLRYVLEESDKEEDISASFDGNQIKFTVATPLIKQWLDPTEVGLSNKDQTQLKILIEKDFKCLHKRPDEDETDSFPNPLAEKR